MSQEVPPVIRRDVSEADRNATTTGTVGSVGKKVEQTHGLECPQCGHDHLIRLRQVYPEEPDHVSYWCLNPQCRYFVSDQLTWATKPHPNVVPDHPQVWDQTAICPDCEKRFTTRASATDRFLMEKIQEADYARSVEVEQ